MIRISAVNYTNSLPFIYGLEHSSIRSEIDLILDYPASCAQRLIDNTADIGLIPVAALLKLPEYHIISDYCIGADGAVDSVFIFSNCPIEDVEFLQLDPESRSSNNLAKVLLKNYWKKNPQKIGGSEDYGKSNHPKTAYVQIGDRTFGRAKDHAYAYDLAEEWKKFTNLPFVFAAWVSNKKLSEEFIFRLNAAFQYGLNHRKEVISKLPVNTSFDYDDYLTNKIDFTLNAEKRKALDLFHKLINELD